ncbi:hypothetical protein FQZ97_746690 [compost metagenome]
MLALARAVAVRQRRLDAGGGVQAGQDVSERHAYLQRPGAGLAVFAAGDAHQAAHALDQEVVAGAASVRPALPKTRNRAVHQARMRALQRVVVQAVGLQAAHFEVLDEDVALRRQRRHQTPAFGRGDVDGDGFLVAVGAGEIGRLRHLAPLGIADPRRPPTAGIVAQAGALDLDDFRAQVGQQLAGPGAGQHARKVQHPQVRQCAHLSPPRLRRGAPRWNAAATEAPRAAPLALWYPARPVAPAP